ncbi:MAG: hypothetical protein AAGC85_13960 [Bacteroidota bacterium]
MLRALTNIPLPQHLAVFLLILLLRLPTFHSAFFLPEESLVLLCAQRLAEGGNLYADAWYAGPPVLVWLYMFFFKLFGSNALISIRIFTCFYLYISAIYFNGMLVTYKPFRKYPGIPSILFVFLSCNPWYAQELGPSLLVLLPVLLAFHAIMQMDTRASRNYQLLFSAGIWMMIAIMAAYRHAFLLMGVVLSYFFLKRARMDELLAIIGGLAICFLGFITVMYVNGNLDDFYDVGLLYYLDRVGLAHTEMYSYNLSYTLKVIAYSWGIILALAVFGFIHFRFKFYNYVVKIRAIETVMLTWLFSNAVMLMFKVSRLDVQDFVLAIPPLVFYATKTFDFRWMNRWRPLVFTLIIGSSLYFYGKFAGLAYPNTFGWTSPKADNPIDHGNNYALFDPDFALSRYFDGHQEDQRVWFMQYQPSLYHRLNFRSATKYTDFRIFFYKYPVWDHKEEVELLSKEENDLKVFQAFENQMPDFIIDTTGYFPQLQERYPALFNQYKEEQIENYHIYFTQDAKEALNVRKKPLIGTLK